MELPFEEQQKFKSPKEDNPNEKAIKDIRHELNSIDDQCSDPIKTIIRSQIDKLEQDNKNKNLSETEVNTYINKVIMPQIEQARKSQEIKLDTTADEKENSKADGNSTSACFSIDDDLRNLKKKYKDGIDTSHEEFQKIITKYKDFFKERCNGIVQKISKSENDPEFREFMIRHNRFVPLFNLRHISPELLEQMAERFERMKKDPDDIQREYDKIELVSTKNK